MSENSKPAPDALDEVARVLRDAPVPPGPPPDLTAATVAAISHRLAGAVPAEHVRRERRRRSMRYVGFGSVAAVLAIVTAGVLLLGGSRVAALGRVMEKVGQAESVTFVERQQIDGQPEVEVKYAIRGHLVRIEMNDGVVLIADTKGKTGLMLVPRTKTYVRVGKDSPDQIFGPVARSPIADLVGLKDRKAEAAEEKVGGRPVQKLTVKGDPESAVAGDWVIWVDPKSELPVKMTCEGKTISDDLKEVAVTKTYEQFAWNVRLGDALFEPKVPAEYKEVKE